jgi:3-dehydroquinate synthase II
LIQSKNKDLIIRPSVPDSQIGNFVSEINDRDIVLNLDPKKLPTGGKFMTIFESLEADKIISKDLDEMRRLKQTGKIAGYIKKVVDTNDIEDILKASSEDADFVIVDAPDWKIIPLENIIAKLDRSKTKIYASANSYQEVRTLFGVLEKGVDGVILSTYNPAEIGEAKAYLNSDVFKLKLAKIEEIKDVGLGERVCVDTISMLGMGEGMLVGSKSNFMFLVHNESVASAFTSARPFRVNAGAVYCYTPMRDGTTKYLSELEAGTEILIVNVDGTTRPVAVGRSKIETRPLRLVAAKTSDDASVGTVILQNAETIRLITKEQKLLPVTELKIGDEVLVSSQAKMGRHFGSTVDEYVLEK